MKNFKLYPLETKRKNRYTHCSLSGLPFHKAYPKMYNIWNSQKQRCFNKNHKAYCNYGARGIIVDNDIIMFKDWIDYICGLENAMKEGYTIDRIDNNKNYEKGNLRWASKSVQMQNTRRLRKNNTSGYRGVKKANNKWLAYINVSNKYISIGAYYDIKEAALARDKYIEENNLEHTKNFN